MKILIPVDPEIPVPPLHYGGIERIVDGLISSYREAGHKVVLVANPLSKSKDADLIYGWNKLHSRGFSNNLNNALKLFKIVKIEKPDIIHSFSRLIYLYPVLFMTNVPLCMTYQREISTKSTFLASLIGRGKIHFTAIASYMKNHIKFFRKNFSTIYNFTLTDYFIPDDTAKKEHLMFLGRIEDIKGTYEAIQAAIKAKQKLVIAGNIQPGHDNYFEEKVSPFLNNPLIKYVGPVNDEQKLYYLQKAKALLFPIKWEEPFGIVMAEAMSCGVPVIAFNRGSVPEIVKHGINGFIVDDIDGIVDAILKINKLDRKLIRKNCEEKFSVEKISNHYITLFQKIIQKKVL